MDGKDNRAEEINRLLDESVEYLNNGEYEKAIEHCNKILEIDPSNGKAYNNIGNAYQYQKRYQEALESYNKAIKNDPTLSEPYCNRANVLGKLGEPIKAIDDYNKAIELNPKYGQAYYNRGNTYANLGEYEEAIKSFEMLYNNEQYFSLAQLRLGSCYEELKKYDEAIRYYKKVKLNDPNYTLAQEDIERIKVKVVNIKITDGYIKKIVELNKAIDGNQPKFTNCILVSVAIVSGILIANIVLAICFSDKNINWLMITVSGTSIAGLILWIARYFNRRIHEDIHLKEEYEHRKILLEMFETYSKTIKDLSPNDTAPMIDFIKNVSNMVSKSPANSLNRKKGDSSAINDCMETLANCKKVVE